MVGAAILAMAENTSTTKRHRRAVRADLASSAITLSSRSLLATRKLNNGMLQNAFKLLREQPELLNASIEQFDAALNGAVDPLIRTALLTLDDDSTFNWEFCDPNLLLARALHDSPFLAETYATALENTPCSQERPHTSLLF